MSTNYVHVTMTVSVHLMDEMSTKTLTVGVNAKTNVASVPRLPPTSVCLSNSSPTARYNI